MVISANRRAVRSILLGSAVAVSSSFAAAAQDAPAEENKSQIEKVVVTAQKRNEELRVVPQSVTALPEKLLERQNLDSFADYAAFVPGMTLSSPVPGNTRLILRGINSDGVGATVGTYLDETPYGSSNALSNGSVYTPDLDTFDISRIEVLRGPQGTLYGSSTLGGLVKFVTNAPDPSGFEGKLLTGLEFVEHGDIGYSAKGMLNVPLTDDLAVRGTAFTRFDGGYIDDPVRGLDDINEAEAAGYRASALWQPGEDFSVRLTAIGQKLDVTNTNTYDLLMAAPGVVAQPFTPVFGDLEQAHLYDQYSDVEYGQYSGTINYDFGFAELTSVTSYSTFTQNQLGEGTLIYGTSLSTIVDFDKFVQEVRLASPESDTFEWLIGFFHTNESAHYYQVLAGLGDLFLDSEFKETAGFANATYHFSPVFDVSFGARYAVNDQEAVEGGPLVPAADTDSSENVFTYAVAPRLHLSDDTMLYARVAKGYRPGGPNAVPPAAPPDVPITYDADSLINYEAGIKTDITERLSLDLSAYFIDWSDIQLLTVIGGYGVNGNGGSAEAKGVEWTVTYVPIDGLIMLFTGAYTDSELKEDTSPYVGGLKGEKLPFTADWTTALSADYSFLLFGDTTGFVGATWAYVGDRAGSFSPTFGRIEIPSYDTVDLRAGIEFERVTLQLYGKNLTDERGITAFQTNYSPFVGGTPGVGAISATIIQPRTIGLQAVARF